MKIGFFAESCLPIHAATLNERPLGGTETALIRLAAALDEKGHDVTVFTSLQEPPASKPRYLPAHSIHNAGPFDVLVLVKDYRPIVFPLNAKKTYFWTGDGPDQFVNFGFGDKRVSQKLNGLLTVSDWQAQTLCEKSGFPIEKTFYIGNGVHLPHFEGSEKRDKKRLIFTSAPYRGLDTAYRAFLELQKKIPDLEFHIFAGFDLYDTTTKFSGPLVKEFQKLKTVLATNKGCVLHGNVTQDKLAREYMKSSLLLYPNSIFETCCIVALEAQAAGCPVITSNNSALPETVRDGGMVVNGAPGSLEYMNELLKLTEAFLLDDTFWERHSRSGRWKIEHESTWNHVAERFLNVITQP